MGTALEQTSGTEPEEYTAVRATVLLLTILMCMLACFRTRFRQVGERPLERVVEQVKIHVTGPPCYTQNLSPDSIDTATLQEVFGSCGNVKSAVVVKGQGGQSTGAAYIHFENHTSAMVGEGDQSCPVCVCCHLLLPHEVSSAAVGG